MQMPQTCPKCGKSICRNDGSVRGNKRYRCINCGARFTLPIHKISKDMKRKILLLYLEGFSLRETGKILGITHVTASKTVKELLPNAVILRKKVKPELIGIEKLKTIIPSNHPSFFLLISEGIASQLNCFFVIESNSSLSSKGVQNS